MRRVKSSPGLMCVCRFRVSRRCDDDVTSCDVDLTARTLKSDEMSKNNSLFRILAWKLKWSVNVLEFFNLS